MPLYNSETRPKSSGRAVSSTLAEGSLKASTGVSWSPWRVAGAVLAQSCGPAAQVVLFLIHNGSKTGAVLDMNKSVAVTQHPLPKIDLPTHRRSSFMIDEFTVRHHEHISARSFDEVIAAFEAAVGSVEDGGIEDDAGATRSLSDFEARIRSREGASGFMRFLTIDHGAWLARNGLDAKARMYTIGNPLIAWTMIKHDLGAGLNVPVRLMIYEDASSGTVRLAYDLPSSLMSRLGDEEVAAAARKLDAKLGALAELATGSPA